MKFIKPNNQLEEGGRSAIESQNERFESERSCPNCHKDIPLSRLLDNNLVCSCGYHFRMKARSRISLVCDEGSFNELFSTLKSDNPIAFPGYSEKLKKAREQSGEEEAIICGSCKINGLRTCIFAMEPLFMMGSMGSAVGEKLTLLFEYALKNHLSVIGFTLSGGARMQEGLLSLMQMAKVSCAVKRHSDAGLLYAAILTDPTTGGVTASFAMQADIILAERGALIAFAGPRVIEQTTKKALPDEFQKSEFVLEHGFVDAIVERSDMKRYLSNLLVLHNVRSYDE